MIVSLMLSSIAQPINLKIQHEKKTFFLGQSGVFMVLFSYLLVLLILLLTTQVKNKTLFNGNAVFTV